MRILTLLRFLVGDRAAIFALGEDRSTPLVGAVFVLSAGLARSYHTVDLAAQPWHLLVPFGVSIVMATVLLLTTFIGPRAKTSEDRSGEAGLFRGRFLPFLGLFWMTAPLAWLYGIPYEMFADPLTATEAKVWTLAAVSLWRVLLITRVLSVLSGRSFAATLFIVMLVADGVVWAALTLVKFPLIQFMSEIPLTETEHFLADIALLTRAVAFLSFFVWLIGAGAAFLWPRQWNLAAPEKQSNSRGAWLVATGAVALAIAALFWTQPSLRLATRVDSLLKGGQIEQGLALMSKHQRGDFPPQWEPPPRVGYGEHAPPLLDVLETMVRTPVADWVRQGYLSSFERRYIRGELYTVDSESWLRSVRLLDALPDGKAVREKYKREIGLHDKYMRGQGGFLRD